MALRATSPDPKTLKKHTHKNKENKKKKTKKKQENKKHKNTKKKMSFLVISQFFLVGVQNFLFWQLGQKSAHPKNTIQIGVSARHFWKTDMRHETAIFGQKIPNPEISVIIFFAFFFSFNNKTQNLAETLFDSVWTNRKIQNLNLKHRTSKKKTIFAPFFWKRLSLENCQIIGHQKTQW